ncbi:hypothetical protein V499_00149 [Pseudogymnoascus sp. VKM F-103]|uniref:Uncharacterized protein n=1 Tax=Pseudogymnoascus verrucosus TaxID=342668 RepID=A0A1B8GUQ7_9PEZI|nr:uncharacterized protein VE01_02776 [Pseudogymnoascus verrucosus]KFY81036.1 hypothetical protein V499_00149 [Pseudogymnoascus sp. VKM F-103]OBT99557.1 hypothetical protein VE01_02776 [Pseudogymnoascus verrucosus]
MADNNDLETVTKTKDLYKAMYELEKKLVATLKAELEDAREKEKAMGAKYENLLNRIVRVVPGHVTDVTIETASPFMAEETQYHADKAWDEAMERIDREFESE